MIPSIISGLIRRNKGLAVLVALYYLFSFVNKKLNQYKPVAKRNRRRTASS